MNDSIYYHCGWIEHAIIIFITKITETNYDLGIINCGQGSEFQGYNNILCNGIIIFKDKLDTKINDFLNSYKKYYDTIHNFKYTSLLTYKSFYLLLFDKILGKSEVDFSDINTENKIKFYELPRQNIGSCFLLIQLI